MSVTVELLSDDQKINELWSLIHHSRWGGGRLWAGQCLPAEAVAAVTLLQNCSEAEYSYWTRMKWVVCLETDFRPNQNFLHSFRSPSPFWRVLVFSRYWMSWCFQCGGNCSGLRSNLCPSARARWFMCHSNSDKYAGRDNQNLSGDLVVVLLINFNDNWICAPLKQAVSSSSQALCIQFQNAAYSEYILPIS